MPTDQEYAQLSARVYAATAENRIPVPAGWSELEWIPDRTYGFSAGVYLKDDDIVIAFTGTNEDADWGWANIIVAGGGPSPQVLEAMLLYITAQREYPTANISFTGHSLGGGIASMMSVFFDRPATVFDHAPFELGARNLLTLAIYRAELAALGFSDSAFNDYWLAAPTVFYQREAQIRSIYLKGEALEPERALWPTITGTTLPPLDPGSPIGVTPRILHSITLLNSMMASDAFARGVQTNPNLIAMLFDSSLYQRDARTSSEFDLLTLMCSRQVGTPSAPLLDLFAADLQRLGITDGTAARADVQKAIAVAVLDYYYNINPWVASGLLNANNGGLHFDYSDIGTDQVRLKSPRRMGEALRPLLSADEWVAVGFALQTYGAWHLQGGTTSMVWAASGDAEDVAVGGLHGDVFDGGGRDDVLIGGEGQDSLTGGSGSDFLIGGAGVDLLSGGSGNDRLMGGADADIYDFSGAFGSDVVEDSGSAGVITLAGVPLTGGGAKRISATSGTWKSDDGQVAYSIVQTDSTRRDLLISVKTGADAGNLTIRNWSDGELGISLSSDVAEPSFANTFTGDFSKQLKATDPTAYAFDPFGNYLAGDAQPLADDLLTGSMSNDELLGLAGNDGLDGSAGDDVIDGGDGDDLLFGSLGADILDGGTGRDFIFGSGIGLLTYPTRTTDAPPAAGGPEYTRGFAWVTYDTGTDANGFHTYAIAGAYGNTLDGDAGNVIDAGAGDDWIRSGSGDDIAHGGADDDNLYGLAGGDLLFGDDGADAIWGDGFDAPGYLESVPGDQHGSDVLAGGIGNDTLKGQGGDDELYGGDDDDLLYGDDPDVLVTPYAYHGNDQLEGGSGRDQLVGGGASDDLRGGTGDDVLVGDDELAHVPGDFHGDDYLDGEEGADQLAGSGGDDILVGGIGNDSLWGDDPGLLAQYQGDDDLDGGEGDDYLEGDGGADMLSGGSGNDILLGGAGADELYGDGEDDRISAGDDDDYVEAGDGHDSLLGGTGDDELFAGIGNDTLFGQAGDDRLDGEGDADTLSGGDGNDDLSGGAGGDLLAGDAGDDDLDGGDGNDQLQGGYGEDMLSGGAGNDTLFGEADADFIDGSTGDDALLGGAGDDLQFGGGGNDQMWGDDGNDNLDGEDGNDSLIGGAGDDSMAGGLDNDALWAIGGNDRLDGGDGDDTLFGATGNDTLTGGAGFDVLLGDAGDDTYVFAEGDTGGLALAESIDDVLGQNHLVFSGSGTIDTASTTATQLSGFWAVGVGNDIVLVKGLLSGSIADIALADGTRYGWQEFLGKTLAFAYSQSTTLGNQQFVGGKYADYFSGAGGGSTFWGGRGDDTLVGGGGNNTYVFTRGDGHDAIFDDSRNPPTGTVRFGTDIADGDLLLSYYGNQLRIGLRGSPGDELALLGYDAAQPTAPIGIAQFVFADGSTLDYASLLQRGVAIGGTSGPDTLVGTSAADTLDGGAGNDLLSGRQGGDTYRFGIGSGNDILADQDGQYGAGDRLLFGPGIAPADLVATRYQNDLVLRLAGSGDSVRSKSYFVPASADTVELIEFDDGSRLDLDSVTALIALHAGEPITGSPGNDVLYGTGGGDSIDGGTGDDALYGSAGDDTLVGAAGSDNLFGGAGSDSYIIGADSQSDTIDERPEGDPADVDTATFVDGVTSQSVTFAANGTSLVVQDAAHGVLLTVAGQLQGSGAAAQIERFVFADGVVLTAQEVANAAQAGSPSSERIQAGNLDDDLAADYGHDTIYGGAGNDRLHGDQGNDTVNGEAGSDSLYGDTGDDRLFGGADADLLDGGAGRDRLDGGDGDDAYLLGPGAGHDIVVQDASGADTVRLAAGLSAANVTLYRVSSPPADDIAFNGDSLVVQLNGGSDQLWIANYFAAATTGYVERIAFADGTSWDYAAVTARLASSGGTPNILVGTRKTDTFAIDHWNDIISNPTPTSGDKATSSVSYRLPDPFLASFTLTGSLNLFALPGNGMTPIVGNAGDNEFRSLALKSGLAFSGGKGNDNYVTRTSADEVTTGMDPAALGGIGVTELVSEGQDTYLSGYWSAQLPANVENLVLLAPNPVSNYNLTFYGYSPNNDFTHKLIGNALDNTIDATLYEDQLAGQWWYSYRTNPLLGAGSFRLDGGSGADTLIGGRGDDTYVIDSAGDLIVETGIAKGGYDLSVDTIESPFDSALSQYAHLENITLTGADAVGATGDSGANRLDGARNPAGNALVGGAGNDTYVVGSADTVVEQAGEGIDTVVIGQTPGTTVRLADYPNVEALTLAGSIGNVDAEGDANANTLAGSLGNNRLSGGDGDDALFDQNAADTLTYYGRFAASDGDLLAGGSGNDALTTYGGNDTLDGGAGDDTLLVNNRTASQGGAQSDILTVRFGLGEGHDILWNFGVMADSYVIEFEAGATVADLALAADDATLVLTLPDDASLRIVGGIYVDGGARPLLNIPLTFAFADGLTLGSTLVQSMLETSDHSTPTAAADLLIGGPGDDTIATLGGDDVAIGADGADNLHGNEGNDTLYGGAGSDTLSGDAGDDLLVGGNRADVYRFSRGFGSDAVDDLPSTSGGADDAAIDTVEFDATVGASEVAVYRRVDGGSVVGTVLVLPTTGDAVDLMHTDEWNSAGAIERIRFIDGTEWDRAALQARVAGAMGGDGADTLYGTSGADLLDGRGGADTMNGLAGDDTYRVDAAGDQVVESAGAGTDTVLSSVDWTLPAEVERLVLVGAAPLRGTGNALANLLTGNAASNRLDGGAGADTMTGGAGDDTYVVDSAGDVLVEQAGEGIDAVESSVSFTLGANVENLRLTGSAKANATGNALDNLLIGNAATNSLTGGAGNDWLDGAAGADAMTGGAGDDCYVVDASNDKTVESASGGYDTVLSSITIGLSSELERLFLAGAAAVNGTGSASANWLVGNDSANTLDGAGGSDVLLGRGGNDTLQDGASGNAFDGGSGDDAIKGGSGSDLLAGGAGSDTLTLGGGSDVVCFDRFDGTDTLLAPANNAGSGEHNDTLSIGQTRLSDLAFAVEGADLVLQLGGTANSLRLKGWYAAVTNQTIARLQWIADSSADYAPGTSDALRNARMATFDFGRLVTAFDAARAADPALASWTPSDAQLLVARLDSSDSVAWGGALAYAHAHQGVLDGVAIGATDQLADLSFATAALPFAIAGAAGGSAPTQPFSAAASAAEALATDSLARMSSDAVPASDGLISMADAMAGTPLEPAGEAAGLSTATLASAPSATLPISVMPTKLPEEATPVPLAAPSPVTFAGDTGEASSFDVPGIGEASADSPASAPRTSLRLPADGPSIATTPVQDAPSGPELPLFPVTPLLQASMPEPPPGAVVGRRAARAAPSWARLQWAAVDAWAALQETLPPAWQSGETGWASTLVSRDSMATFDGESLDPRVALREVRRLEHTTRFSLARLN